MQNYKSFQVQSRSVQFNSVEQPGPRNFALTTKMPVGPLAVL